MNKTGLFFRVLAIASVLFIGMAVILPKTTFKDDEANIPAWTDISVEDSKYVKTVYANNIMTLSYGDEFGANYPITAGEAAYAGVRLYEKQKDMKFSFNEFKNEQAEEYVKKAEEYGLWHQWMPAPDSSMSREAISVVLAPLVEESENPKLKTFADMENFGFSSQVLKLYNCGITTDTRIMTAYSPYVEMTRGEAAKVIAMCIDPSLRMDISVPDYSVMEGQLKDMMSQWQGDWSLYFEDYKTGAYVSVNSHQVYSASLIKLFVAQTVYQNITDGTIKDSSKVQDELRKMITYSDNDAWKYLAQLLGGGSYSAGMNKVTDLAQASGFTDTGQFYKGSHRNFNFTSVEDCGRYMSMVLDGRIVSESCSDSILSLLKQQYHTQKIPAGVPEGIVTANKTGELDYVQGDAAIVFAPNRTYILVIIGDDLKDSYGQVPHITEASKCVYDFVEKTQ